MFENKVCFASPGTRYLLGMPAVALTTAKLGTGRWCQGKLKCHKAHLLRLIWFFSINHFPAYHKILIRFQSSEKVDSHSIASLFIAFEKEQIFGTPYSTTFSEITLPISFEVSTYEELSSRESGN